MEVSGELHPWGKSPIPTEQKAGLAPEVFWMQWLRKDKSLHFPFGKESHHLTLYIRSLQNNVQNSLGKMNMLLRYLTVCIWNKEKTLRCTLQLCLTVLLSRE